MTFAGNVILILSPWDSGVKYYRKPGGGGQIQDQKSHRFPIVIFFLLCSPVRAVGNYPNACRLQSALEDGFSPNILFVMCHVLDYFC